jgi:hypothetical protein
MKGWFDARPFQMLKDDIWIIFMVSIKKLVGKINGDLSTVPGL